jgi:hypothetical protein
LLQHTMAGQDSVRHLFFSLKKDMLFFKLVELELQRIAKLSVRLRFQQHHQLGPWTLLVFTRKGP